MPERAIYAGHLAEHADPTEEIAEQLGYTDASHFTRDFRRYYGMTTYQWRELCRRNSWRADGVRIRLSRSRIERRAKAKPPAQNSSEPRERHQPTLTNQRIQYGISGGKARVETGDLISSSLQFVENRFGLGDDALRCRRAVQARDPAAR